MIITTRLTPGSASRPPPAPPQGAAKPVTLSRLIHAEWVKFSTLRSTRAVLTAAFAGMVVIAMIIAYNTRHLTANLQANDLSASATLQGYYLGQLLIGALGVLFVSSEYSTGSIRSTFVAAPRRLPVLWAKLVVITTVSVTTMLSASLTAFLLAQALLSHYRPGYSLSDPSVVRVIVGTGIYLALVTLLGLALGWIVRSIPGALVAFFALVVALPTLLGNVFGSTGQHIAEYLPTTAGAAFSTTKPEGLSLQPWTGLGLMALWALALLVVAGVLLRRRDA